MMEQSLFDINNVADLPADTQKFFNGKGLRKGTVPSKIKVLFDIKNTLSVLELVAGLYRHYGDTYTPRQVHVALNSLIRSSYIKRSPNTCPACYEVL